MRGWWKGDDDSRMSREDQGIEMNPSSDGIMNRGQWPVDATDPLEGHVPGERFV